AHGGGPVGAHSGGATFVDVNPDIPDLREMLHVDRCVPVIPTRVCLLHQKTGATRSPGKKRYGLQCLAFLRGLHDLVEMGCLEAYPRPFQSTFSVLRRQWRFKDIS